MVLDKHQRSLIFGVEKSILSKLSKLLLKSALFRGYHSLQNFACSTHFTENRLRRCENTDYQKEVVAKNPLMLEFESSLLHIFISGAKAFIL